MKKLYTLILSVSMLAVSAWAATDDTRLVIPASDVHVRTAASAVAQATVIVDEDFSGLVRGSESKPDSVSLLNTLGFVADTTMFKPYAPDCSRTWGGYNLYAAGGCLAVMNGGFVNTPAGDYSGQLTISFRAKMLDGVTTSGRDLDILLCRSNALIDFKRVTVELTPEWKTYTMTADNGGFATTMVQLFTMNDEMSYLVDDFHIEHIINSIPAPEAYDASDLQADGFTAHWDTTETAKEYLVSVYTKSENPEGTFAEEGFEGVNCDASGVVDATDPNLPEGWEIQWKGDGKKGGMCREAGYYANGKQSLRLSADGDYVATPTYKNNFTSFKFWIKGRNNKKNSDTAPDGLVQISALTASGWMPWAYVSVDQLCKLGKGVVLDRTDKVDAFEQLWGVKLTYMPGENDDCEIFIDDITYRVPGADLIDYAVFDHVVTGRASDSYTVRGLNPDKDYWFSVKARNDEYTSAPSEEIEVFDVHQPTALDATGVDIEGDRYTANWTCGAKADYFRVDQVKTLTVDKDVDDYVILEEDFSKVVSDRTEEDFDDPELGEYTSTYEPIDQYTHIAGWKASSVQKINGWLGGMEKGTETGMIAGAIVTPTIDLSHNDGECNVTVRAYGTQGDWLIIRGTNEAAYSAISFPDDGVVESTVSVPLCTSAENLTFYSNNYLPFLIDNIRITQNVKAGEQITIVNKSVATADATIKSLDMTDADLAGNYDVKYKVTAFRYYHGDTKNIWSSRASNLVTVRKFDPSGIDDAPKGGTTVRVVSGGVAVDLSAAATVCVYDASGVMVENRQCEAGTTILPLSHGFYVVKVAGRALKVAVK